MIGRNPITHAWVVVWLTWYVGLFLLLSWVVKVWPFELVTYLPRSLVVMLVGALCGMGLILVANAMLGLMQERELRSGTTYRQARISLGKAPIAHATPRGRLPANFWDTHPWWPRVRDRFPEHARAIQAVLEVMHAVPDLPASPVPGGHGGRTLIEHSMAVAGEILSQARSWVYEGQKDRYGRVRVRLRGDEPHRFGADDIGLLVLTGLAHDIGKVTCYERIGRDEHGRVLVQERHPNHDTMGARLLRTLPEVMALPYADRTALLLAVGYYHHAYAIPLAEWVTDRMRSLTELLIRADIETGRKEGHALTAMGYAHEEAEDEEEQSEAPAQGPIPIEDDEPLVSIQPPESLARRAEPPRPIRSEAPPAKASAPLQPAAESLPLELDLLLKILRRDGAINGKHGSQRVAWKYEDKLYVMELPFRRQVASRCGMPPDWIATELEDNAGNAAPFTARLLEQLKAKGWLFDTWEGVQYTPSRCLFVVGLESGGEIPAFIVRAEAFPWASGIPDAKPIRIKRPFWNRRQPKAEASPTPAPASSAVSTVADADLPVDLPTLPPASVAASPKEACAHAEGEAPGADDAQALAEALPAALTALVTSPEWSWPFEVREHEGQTMIVVDVESEGGAAITAMLERYRQHGVPVSAIRLVRRRTTGQRAYMWRQTDLAGTSERSAA